MVPIFLILALVSQCSFIYADTDVPQDNEDLREILKKPILGDDADDDILSNKKDFLDMFILPSNNMFPTSSATLMAQISSTNKTAEEQLKDIKEMAEQISIALEKEMVGLFNFAMAAAEKDVDDNGIRKRRSVETPMDSTQLVMRLLKHIKSNNEYQNIAIENMMTAQEIADKFGIEYNPDTEILSALAEAANEHAQEMAHLLKNAYDLKNVTQEKVEFIPLKEEPKSNNKTYYVYSIRPEEKTCQEFDVPPFEYLPEILSKPQPPVNHAHHAGHHPVYGYPYESQITSPPVHYHSAPVTPKPSFYDPFSYPFTPVPDCYSPLYAVESAILLPIEDPEPEPELACEEIEETITSKMFVERGDEPGSATVNHVTSYTISEKSHFKPPQIEQLPQHFQYCFFLM